MTSLYVVLVLPLVTAAKMPPINEGEWQTTVKVEMPGLPVAMPPITHTSCITKKDLVPNAQPPGQECKLKSHKVTGSSVEWRVECKSPEGGSMQGSGKVTYSGDTFAGAMQMSIQNADAPAMNMSYQLSGRRLGPCKKK